MDVIATLESLELPSNIDPRTRRLEVVVVVAAATVATSGEDAKGARDGADVEVAAESGLVDAAAARALGKVAERALAPYEAALARAKGMSTAAWVLVPLLPLSLGLRWGANNAWEAAARELAAAVARITAFVEADARFARARRVGRVVVGLRSDDVRRAKALALESAKDASANVLTLGAVSDAAIVTHDVVVVVDVPVGSLTSRVVAGTYKREASARSDVSDPPHAQVQPPRRQPSSSSSSRSSRRRFHQ